MSLRCSVLGLRAPCRRVGSLSVGRTCPTWATPLHMSFRAFFVRFQETPNEACYKFYVDGKTFLPPGTLTMMFDRSNDYQSPLAHDILSALPMVEEVTVGSSFITVKRVEEAHAAAAARYFAMKFHGTSGIEDSPEETAARSEALQARVDAAMHDDDGVAMPPPASPPSSSSSETPHAPGVSQETDPNSFDLGGFTVEKAQEAEAIDEAALEALIAATDWSELKLHVSALLTDHLISGEPHIAPDAPHPHVDTLPQDGDSEVVLMLKELISTTIRPQLQDDGGDIRFVRYDAEMAVMEVEMLGACRTCKSSKTTLVDLIERTTRHWVPEVAGVREVLRAASPFEAFLNTSERTATTAHGLDADGEMEMENPADDDVDGHVTDAAGRVRVRDESDSSAHRVLRSVKAASD